MKLKTQRLRARSCALLLVACGGCQRSAHDEHSADAEPSGSAVQTASDRISIPATVRENLGISFATVEVRRVADTLRVPGAFELRPLARHEYRMALPGRVELLVDQYQRVSAGEVLFRFQSPAWPELLHEIILGEQEIETAQAQIGVSKAALRETERRLELASGRIQALAQADFRQADLEAEAAVLEASLPRSRAELVLARTRLQNAERTREHALHRASTAAGIPEQELEQRMLVGVGPEQREVPKYMTIDWIEVRAVEAGIVELLAVTDGAFIEPPTNVLSIVDPEKVRFKALALQGDLPRLLRAQEARVVPPRSPDISVNAAVDATLSFGLEAHPMERTLTLVAVPSSLADWIRPGVSAFLEVTLEGSEPAALAVPRSAIVQDGLSHVFFRRDPKNPNEVIRVEADMGVSDGRWVVLESGVMRGDEVVLAGAYELKLASGERAGQQAGGHMHPDGTFHDE